MPSGAAVGFFFSRTKNSHTTLSSWSPPLDSMVLRISASSPSTTLSWSEGQSEILLLRVPSSNYFRTALSTYDSSFSQHDCETLPAAALPEPETICDFETDLCGWTAEASPGGLNFYRTSGTEVVPGRGVVLDHRLNLHSWR